MSSYSPPSIISSIYNPSFFTTSTEGLTQSEANSLYLRKTTPDTASALETFSSGIATNSIVTTTLASNFLIGSSTNTGTVTIATINTGNTNASPAISIGTDSGSKTIRINNFTNSVHCSAIDLKGGTINNISNASGIIELANGQTDGILNIATGTARTSAVNIATASANVFNVNIGTATTTLVCGGPISASGAITANNGLVMGNGKNITLQSATGYVTPSSNTQLGFSTSVTGSSISLTSGTDTQIATTATLPVGTYVVTGYVSISGGVAQAQAYVWIAESVTAYASRKTESSILNPAGAGFTSSVSYVASNTAGPFKLVAQLNTTGGSAFGTIYAVRIA